ncbi:glutamate racemase [Candidatus Uhrbacteria bacterium]|nr:glutamate racemase [Candidatus Uhrbacteria bacterium]
MIGIFDSGIGGLTVVKELLRQAPDVSFVYLGDTARTPYGNKSAEVVRQYALEDAQFLIDQGATSIIIACHTASALAEQSLRESFPKIPIFGMIHQTVDAALALKPKHLGVIGTRATIGSNVYPAVLKEMGVKKIAVQQVACPLFTVLAEEGLLDDQVTKLVAKKYLSGFRAHPLDVLIMGCTHYPLLRAVIQHAVTKRTTLIDPAQVTVAHILNVLPDIERTKKQVFFLSDVASHTVQIATKWMGKKIEFEKAVLQ